MHKQTRCTNGGSTSHIGKKQAVDAHEQTQKEDCAKFASFAAMEFDEEKHTSQSNAEMFSAAEIMHRKLQEQMQCS